MMNGDLVRDATKADVFKAGGRIGYFAPTDEAAVEVAYLTILTRKPTPEESHHFAAHSCAAAGERAGRRGLADL